MPCPSCAGAGVVATVPPTVCPECLGSGAPSDRSRRLHVKDRHHTRAAARRRFRR